jgi:nickel-type superoxide dismutase maturation protease
VSDLTGLPRFSVHVAAGVAGACLVGVLASRWRRVSVRGTSMTPTLEPADRLLVVRWGRPSAGHLVALRDPRDQSRVLVKRVAEIDTRSRVVTVLGDNPAASTDSRVFGAVPFDAVVGRVVYRYAPAGRAGRVR